MRTPLRRLEGVTVTVEKLLSLELLGVRRCEEPFVPLFSWAREGDAVLLLRP
jgi:hypothetical protein